MLIVGLFIVQVTVLLAVVMMLLLVYSPLRRIVSPITNLIAVTKSLIGTMAGIVTNTKSILGRALVSVNRLSSLFKGRGKSNVSRFSLKKALTALVAVRRFYGAFKLVRQLGKNKFWGTFRMFMLLGPIIVPALTTLKRFLRKPATIR
jgi:hypothetical protein